MTEKMLTIGSRAQVWHRTAKKTSGGLTRNHLMMNKSGRIVSKAKHNTAKRENRLLKHGYGTKKGKFGFVKIGSRKNRKGMKGGSTGVMTGPGGNTVQGTGSFETAGLKGGSKRMKGGLVAALGGGLRGGSGMGELSPAHANGSYMIKDVVSQPETPLTRALVGGKFKSGHRLNGGAAYGSGLYPADLKGSYMIKDVVPQKFSPLDRALVGGKRGRKMRGGTGTRSLFQGSEPSSVDVQMRAGQGN
jgi:hypothetical protein